jgi:hypothetical protein
MLALRVAPDTQEALKRAAADDERSVSSMVERVLRDLLVEKGYLEGKKKA